MKKKKKQFTFEIASRAMTKWTGSPTSIIVHTVFFVAIFFLRFFGISFEKIMLILTTAVSLEAIYLSLFIQMTVNRNTQSLEDVGEDLDEIQADVEAIETSVEDLGEEVEDISADVDEISADIDEIQADDDIYITESLLTKKNEQLQTDINATMMNILNEVKNLKEELKQLKQSS